MISDLIKCENIIYVTMVIIFGKEPFMSTTYEIVKFAKPTKRR